MMTLSALNQFLKQHTTEETQRLNGVKKDYSQFPETSCQGLFHQIHEKSTKKVPEAPYGS